nr:phenol hydroxylase subunit [Ottowia beijingensis]
MTHTAIATDASATPQPVCDLSQRFVRVLGRRDNGFVELLSRSDGPSCRWS